MSRAAAGTRRVSGVLAPRRLWRSVERDGDAGTGSAFRWVGMFEVSGLEIPRLKYPAALRVC